MVELFGDEPSSVELVERFRSSFGGDALQAALTASNLGTPSAVATVLGDDPFAEALRRRLERWGLATDHLVQRQGFTGLYLISIGRAGERSFVYYRKGSAASTLNAADVAWEEPPDAVLVTGITQAVSESSRRAALEAARRTRERGGLVAFDVNFRPRLWHGGAPEAREAFEELAPLAHVLRLAAPEETALVADHEDPTEAARGLASRGVPIVVVGCGSGGAVAAADGAVERIPAPAVACIDTTGAGDALTGGLVHGLLAGMSPVEAARLGVAAGSVAVTRRGGASSIPSGPEVLEMFGKMEDRKAGATQGG
jgi:2-dehydro-3-deoxygluconokinase